MSTIDVEKLQEELSQLRERERMHLEHIAYVEEENNKFQIVAAEFEKIFHQVVKDMEDCDAKYKTMQSDLTKERDGLIEDLIGIQRSFNDLHKRHERLREKTKKLWNVCNTFSESNNMVYFRIFTTTNNMILISSLNPCNF